MTFQNFTFEIDADGIALIAWNMPGRSMNVIDAKVMEELAAIVERVATDAAVKGAVLTSGKEAFCAGADLSMLETQSRTFAELRKSKGEEGANKFLFEESCKLSQIARRMETCGKPWVAAINGTAMGGGLELALAFRFPQFRERAALRLQHAQIGAGAERLLAGGEYCALDGGVGRDPLDDRRQLFHHFGVDHVHRPARHVPGDQGNAVSIDLEGEILEGHTHLPFVSLFASPQRQRENYFEYGLPSLWLKCPPLSSRIITRSRSGYSARSCFERVPISRKIASRPDLLTR